jgi:hypothetical protein
MNFSVVDENKKPVKLLDKTRNVFSQLNLGQEYYLRCEVYFSNDTETYCDSKNKCEQKSLSQALPPLFYGQDLDSDIKIDSLVLTKKNLTLASYMLSIGPATLKMNGTKYRCIRSYPNIYDEFATRDFTVLEKEIEIFITHPPSLSPMPTTTTDSDDFVSMIQQTNTTDFLNSFAGDTLDARNIFFISAGILFAIIVLFIFTFVCIKNSKNN